MIWNAVAYADVAKEDSMLLELHRTLETDRASQDRLNGMIRLKRLFFTNNEGTMGQYNFYEQEGEMR
jgi:hypothetical protein